MDIKELKEAVEQNTLQSDMQVWVLSDDSSRIITDQYIRIIAQNKHLQIKYLYATETFKTVGENNRHLLNQIPDASFITDENLYIIVTDKWDISDTHENCIVLCKKGNGVTIPKLEDWQILDYAASIASGIDREYLEFIMSRYSTNYQLFLNDVEKLAIFYPSEQRFILDELLDTGALDYARSETIFMLADAIVTKDIKTIQKVLRVLNYIDVEPLGLLVVLYKKFKQILEIQCNPSATAQSLGVTDKQFYAIKKRNCGYYNNDDLIRIVHFLSGLEETWLLNGLEYNQMIDYIIFNILGGTIS